MYWPRKQLHHWKTPYGNGFVFLFWQFDAIRYPHLQLITVHGDSSHIRPISVLPWYVAPDEIQMIIKKFWRFKKLLHTKICKNFDIDIKIWGHLPGFRFSVWCVFCCCSAWNVQAIIKAINAGQRLPAGWTFDLFLFSFSKILVAKAVVGMMAWYRYPPGN